MDEKPQDIVYQLAGSDGVLYAARQMGLFLSTDGGQSWQDCYSTINRVEPLPTLAVALPPQYAKGEPIFAGLAGGLLCSSNGGATWENILLPAPPPVITALAFSPNYEQDGIIFAASLEDGVLFSADRGGRWAAWNFGLLDLNALCLAVSPDFARDETVFIGTQSGIFRSTNGGRAWREVILPVGFEAVLSLAFSPSYTSDHTLFAGTESQGLLVSHDDGDHWQKLAEGQLSNPINMIIISPDDPQKIFVLHSGQVLQSDDGGLHWSAWCTETLTDLDVSAIYAPQGFAPGTRVWLGLANGEVISLSE